MDYEYFSKHYKLIAIDLSKQIELENPDLKQQINFIGKLERNEGATMFFFIEKSEETTFEFSQFVTRKCYVINDQNYTDYADEDENGTTIKFETKVIKSNICDY